ncbi:hypothetical protein [Aquimarina algiphila]|uniref:hypothetical protein n=1 Tax=Aquimarina algiphila TaxID=2047982 RepID=UPI002492B736|nr:hypothetical protein [Aquimarina algiphila]
MDYELVSSGWRRPKTKITKTSGIVLQASGIKMRGRSQVLGVGNQMLRDYKIIGYQVTVDYVYNLVQ